MSEPNVGKLKTESFDAAARGDWKRALECYRALLAAEPAEAGKWAQKAAEACRRLGLERDAVTFYVRAAELYATQGMVLRAIALSKLLAELAPGDTHTHSRLAALCAAAGHGPSVPPPATTPSTVVATLGEASLGRALPGAQPWVPEPAQPEPAQEPEVQAVPEELLEPDASAQSADEEAIIFDLSADLDLAAVGIDVGSAREDASEPGDRKTLETLERVLPRTPLFSALSERHLRSMIDRVLLVSLEPAEVLFREGDAGEALFVLVSGELAVLVQPEGSPGAAPVEVSRLHEGEFFGEIALLAEQPRSATVRALAPSEVLCIHREAVNQLLAEAPELLPILLRFVRERLLNSVVAAHPLFAQLAPRERASVASHFRLLEVDRGALLVREGGPGAALFLLLAGKVSRTRRGQPPSTLGPGALFGLDGLEARPSPWTLRSTTRCFVFALRRADLAALAPKHPALLDALRSKPA